MPYTATSTYLAKAQTSVFDHRTDHEGRDIAVYMTDHEDRTAWSLALRAKTKAELLAWLAEVAAEVAGLPDDEVETSWCERCGETPDELDPDSGLCPTCVANNEGRVAL